MTPMFQRRPYKERVQFYLEEGEHATLLQACGELDCTLSDLVRASLHLAVPTLVHNPLLFEYFKNTQKGKSKEKD